MIFAAVDRPRAHFAWALLLSVLLLTGCKVELYSNLSEVEANEMLSILLRNGIDAAKTPVGDGLVSLQVEETEVADAIEILKINGYPHKEFESIGQIFQKSGLISSPLEERIRFIYALSQEISETLSEIDGVLSARVHVVLPDNQFADENTKPSSAAVFIRYQSDRVLDTLVPQIKMLVTNSIEGLTYEKVSVILFPVDMPPEEGVTFEQIGPVLVHPSSVTMFWLLVGGLGLLAVAALAGDAALYYLLRRRPQPESVEDAG